MHPTPGASGAEPTAGHRMVAVLLAALVLLGVAPLATLASSTAAGADALPVVGSFTWTMPSRYTDLALGDDTADGYHDDVTELFDRNHDGHPDTELIEQLRAFVNPDTWHVDLDACGISTERPVVGYRWERVVDGAMQPIGESTSCRGTSFEAEDEGTWPVRLTLTLDDGSEHAIDRDVVVSDILVVGMGDSYGSGEGNPEWEGPDFPFASRWSNMRCHRSVHADQAIAAQRLEAAERQSSVTFVHVARSGAQIGLPQDTNPTSGGVLQPYDGAECWVVVGCGAPLPPQVVQVRELLDGDGDNALDRQVDALLLSAGGNDANFAPILAYCAKTFGGASCEVDDVDWLTGEPAGGMLWRWGRANLADRLHYLPGVLTGSPSMEYGNGMTGLGIDPGRVIHREYPDPTWERAGVRCRSIMGGMRTNDLEWAGDTVLPGINGLIQESATRAGFQYVDGVNETIAGTIGGVAHGECAGDARWYRWLAESFWVQGNYQGVMHPNREGHRAMGQLEFEHLRPLLTAVEATPSCVPTLGLSTVPAADGGVDVTGTASAPCGDVELSWRIDGSAAGTGPTVHVTPDRFVCGTARVSLTGVSPTWEASTATTVATSGTGVPSQGSPAPDAAFTDPLASATYRAPYIDVRGTSCDEHPLGADGYPLASVGWGTCLPEADAGVQPGPARMPCGSTAQDVTFARGAYDPVAARTEVVSATDVHHEDPLGTDVRTGLLAGSGEQQYRVVAPAGTTVPAEVRVRASGSAAAGIPPADGDPVGATAELAFTGDVSVSRMVDDPACAEPGTCDLVPGDLGSIARWSLETSADSCAACVRWTEGEGNAIRAEWNTSDERLEAYRISGGEEVDVVDPGDRLGDGPGATGHDGDDASWFGTHEVTIPVTLQAGDILTQVIGLDHVAGGHLGARASAQLGAEIDIVALSPDVAIVPLITEAVPGLSVGSIEVVEGDAGTSTVQAPVTLSSPSDETVTAAWSFEPASTVARDIVASTGTVSIPAGQTSGTISVAVRGDVADEQDEVALLRLVSATGASASPEPGVVTVVDDDDPPVVAVGDVVIDEGQDGTRTAYVPVQLSAPTHGDVVITWATSPGSATAPRDYRHRTGTVTVAAGTRAAFLAVPVVGDAEAEADESFAVSVNVATSSTGVTAVDPTGTVTIRDDEVAPGVRIGDVTVLEADETTRTVRIPVHLPSAAAQDVTIDYRGVAASATNPADVRVATAGQLVIPAGRSWGFVPVKVVGDLQVEGTETYEIQLTGVSGGLDIEDAASVLTIVDQD